MLIYQRVTSIDRDQSNELMDTRELHPKCGSKLSTSHWRTIKTWDFSMTFDMGVYGCHPSHFWVNSQRGGCMAHGCWCMPSCVASSTFKLNPVFHHFPELMGEQSPGIQDTPIFQGKPPRFSMFFAGYSLEKPSVDSWFRNVSNVSNGTATGPRPRPTAVGVRLSDLQQWRRWQIPRVSWKLEEVWTVVICYFWIYLFGHCSDILLDYLCDMLLHCDFLAIPEMISYLHVWWFWICMDMFILMSKCIGKYNMTHQNSQMGPSFVIASNMTRFVEQSLWMAVISGSFGIEKSKNYIDLRLTHTIYVVANFCESIDRINQMEATKWFEFV